METRTIDDIFSQISDAKTRVPELHEAITDDVTASPDLSGLNSSSQVAIFRLWAFITAACMWVLEKRWQEFKTEVDELANASWFGTIPWWLKKAKAFQYGDVLTVINEVPKYPTVVDETDPKRIVAFAAITETLFGGAILKVGKTNGDTFTALTTAEKDAFNTYVKQLQPPGSKITVISEEPDELRVFGTVYYNAQYTAATVKAGVEAAIQAYRRELTDNGEVLQSKVQDVMQVIPGVNDVVLSIIEARANGGTWSIVQRKYQTYAGYAIIDPATPLSTSISYIAE